MATKAVIPRHGSCNFKRLDSVIGLETARLTDSLMPTSPAETSLLLKPSIMSHCTEVFCHFLVSKRFTDLIAGSVKSSAVNYDEIVRLYDFIFWDINQCYSTDFLPILSSAGINKGYLAKVGASCDTVR